MFPIVTIPRREKGKDAQKPPQEPSLGAPIASRDSRRFVNGMSLTVAIIVWVAGLIGTIVVGETMGRDDLIPAVLLPAVFLGLYLMFAIKVVDQWEKAVILRFGRFQGLKGPGLFFIIPVVDMISHLVDQRVRATDVTAELSAIKRANADIVYTIISGPLGIVLGRQESDALRLPIALLGKVYCKVDAAHARVDVGDLLVSSPTPGHAMKGVDPARVNVNGGAIALGHPIGASGARVLTTLLYAMLARDKATGLATLCLGGGNAVALSVERI